MSKAVSKAPDSGQVTSAPTRRRADGRGTPKSPPAKQPNPPENRCATGGPKTILARGRLGESAAAPSSTRHRREGEKRDLTALELRSYVRRLGTAAVGGWMGILRGQCEPEREMVARKWREKEREYR